MLSYFVARQAKRVALEIKHFLSARREFTLRAKKLKILLLVLRKASKRAVSDKKLCAAQIKRKTTLRVAN